MLVTTLFHVANLCTYIVVQYNIYIICAYILYTTKPSRRGFQCFFFFLCANVQQCYAILQLQFITLRDTMMYNVVGGCNSAAGQGFKK